MVKEEFSKYERARILGARALQLSMDAPVLAKVGKEELSALNFDPLRVAELELDTGVLPISVNRPMPNKREEKLREIKHPHDVSDKQKVHEEHKEERDVAEEGEIMELANPEDEMEDFAGEEEGGEYE